MEFTYILWAPAWLSGSYHPQVDAAALEAARDDDDPRSAIIALVEARRAEMEVEAAAATAAAAAVAGAQATEQQVRPGR